MGRHTHTNLAIGKPGGRPGATWLHATVGGWPGVVVEIIDRQYKSVWNLRQQEVQVTSACGGLGELCAKAV